MANIKQGGAEKTALFTFGILIVAALASWFLAVPIWVKAFNIAVAGIAFIMMVKTNTKSSNSEVKMIAVWIVAVVAMAIATFTQIP